MSAAIERYSETEAVRWAVYVSNLLAEVLSMIFRYDEAGRASQSVTRHREEEACAGRETALAILRESVRRRQTDPTALRQVREHLKRRM